ncbi:MAG: single-stranded-DNA-specific exonuclease RecJ [Dehalococcoidia bacterium]
MGNQQVRWQLLPRAPDEYLRAANLPPIIAQLLYNRGVKLGEIEPFLLADHRLGGNPFLLPGMSQAVSRIHKALLIEEKIAIYGDFDVDGITATATLAEGLSWLGGKVTPYIPHRLREGHGLKLPALENLHSQGMGLIITVDCGVTSITEAKQAQEMGLDMIITDHHVPLVTLPQAIAVIDAKRKDSQYPFSELAGVGVAFKLLQALFYKDGREKRVAELLDLVALGTVTDVVPIIGENRYLVKEGLKVLNNTQRIGLQELGALARLKLGELNTKHISKALGPRLNAASRMDDATTSYHLVTTHSPEEAHALAQELEASNTERQRLTDEVLRKAKERLAHKLYPPLLIEGHEGYPVGVTGLVAGKLVDEFYKPAIILNLGPEICRGSARSIPEFNVAEALEKCQDLLITFGGHPLAAGFTVKQQNLAQLEERLMKLAKSQLSHLDLCPKLVIDAEVPLSAFAGDAFNLIQQLEPFGQGNSNPTFLTRQVEVIECRNFGNQDKHLELKLKQGNITWRAVDFDSQKTQEEIPSYLDIVYTIEKSFWNGEQVLRLNLRDFAPNKAAISYQPSDRC